nr:hypothetical protein JUJ52_01730 [Virgibacillus sp. AGTR]
MFVPQGYDLKAFAPIGHLLAIVPPLTNFGFSLLLEVGNLIANCMWDKVKLLSVGGWFIPTDG